MQIPALYLLYAQSIIAVPLAPVHLVKSAIHSVVALWKLQKEIQHQLLASQNADLTKIVRWLKHVSMRDAEAHALIAIHALQIPNAELHNTVHYATAQMDGEVIHNANVSDVRTP